MARGLNKVMLIGNLGADPEIRYTTSNQAITNVRLATAETWKDKESGEPQERTEWHRVAFFGRLAEIAAEYLKKGAQVYIEGSIRSRQWVDKEGVNRYSTEIVASEMHMLGGRREGGDDGGARPARAARNADGGAARQTNPRSGDSAPPDDFDDDIPF